MQYICSLSLALFYLFLTLANSQFSPTWQQSPYLEAKNTVIVSNGQKTFGTYTYSITFIGTFTTPILVLGKPLVTQPSPS
jgi:hypothetical protein